MNLRTSSKDLSEVRADVAACFAYEGDKKPRGVRSKTLERGLAAEMSAESFRGQAGDSLVWNGDGQYASHRFLVIGLGKEGDGADAIRRATARAARAAAKLRAKTLAVCLPNGLDPVSSAVRAAVEGVLTGEYEFDRYLTDPDQRPSRLTTVTVASDATASSARKAATHGRVTGRAVAFARDLVNEPPSRMNPRVLAREAVRAAKEAGLRSSVLGPREIARLGMRALAAVALGSSVPPQVVHLVYRPRATGARKTRRRKIVLLGKGVTFDSGGLNLKPGASMNDMKSDMGGAAAVIAAMAALRDVGCKDEVHGLVGLVENMTGSSAYKPGDILETYLGKTVEITNTDAEGRLVLADLLAHAVRKIRPDAMVDLATLTGACVVALGTQASGVFSRHSDLSDDLLGAAALAGEKMWPLPMYEEYLESLQGGQADLRNAGDRWGGAITAALFLGEFVPRDLPWAHVDIAGPAYAAKATPFHAAGATGAGVGTLLRWLGS